MLLRSDIATALLTAILFGCAVVLVGAPAATRAEAPRVAIVRPNAARYRPTPRRILTRVQAARIAQNVNQVSSGSIAPASATGTRTMNCLNCSIATDHSLDGRETMAMPGQATFPEVVEAEYGRRFTYGDRGFLERTLHQAGPGARAIVMGEFSNGARHYFNAVQTSEGIAYLDGQSGRDITRVVGDQLRVDGFLRTDDLPEPRAAEYRTRSVRDVAAGVAASRRPLGGTARYRGRVRAVRVALENGNVVFRDSSGEAMNRDEIVGEVTFPVFRAAELEVVTGSPNEGLILLPGGTSGH